MVGPCFAHFALAPKIAIEPLPLPEPDQILFDTGSVKATRGEFSDYLQRLTAFQTKYQRLQPTFSAHFELLQSVAFYHPENVHQYIDSLAPVRERPDMYRFAVSQWIRGQLGVYARLKQLGAEADSLRQDKDDSTAVIDFYAAGSKTALLEELIVAGDMPPSIEGLAKFVARDDDQSRYLIANGPPVDTVLTPPEEQRRLKDRWRAFRRDVLNKTPAVNRCDTVNSPSDPADTVVVEVAGKEITLADYLAIFGMPETQGQWASLKRANCSRLVLFYSMAEVAQEMKLEPARIKRDIAASRQILRMAQQLAARALTDPSKAIQDLQISPERPRYLLQKQRLTQVKDWLLARSANETAAQSGKRYLDNVFITDTQWRLERVLAPKHSIHM